MTSANCEKYRPIVAHYFPSAEVDNALAVMNGESTCRPNAVGDRKLMFKQNGNWYGYSTGLMQIRNLPGRRVPTELLDPETNISEANKLFRQHGWQPWTAAHKLGLTKPQTRGKR